MKSGVGHHQVRCKQGSYQIDVSGNVLSFSGEGPWDKITVERYNKDMRTAIGMFNGKAWAFLGYLKGLSILTPDAEQALQDAVIWRANHKMTMCALVTESATIPELARSQFERIYEGAGVKYGIFNNRPSALTWLARQGFSPAAA